LTIFPSQFIAPLLSQEENEKDEMAKKMTSNTVVAEESCSNHEILLGVLLRMR
jgi:hypothetical protein